MSEFAKQFDSFPVVGSRCFFLFRKYSDVLHFVIKSDRCSPRSRTTSSDGAHTLESAYIPQERFIRSIMMCAALSEILFAAIQAVVVSVVHQNIGIIDPENHSVQQRSTFVCSLFRLPDSCRSCVERARRFAPAGKPFEFRHREEVFCVHDGELSLVEWNVPDGRIFGNRDRDLINRNRLFTASAISVGDRIFGRGHARSNQRVGFIRCLQHLTPQVYQAFC